jgi:hypothetical protein
MIHYKAPKPAFHKEHDTIKYSLRLLARDSQSPATQRVESKRLIQKYINLDLAQAMHEMRRNHA